MNSPAEQYTKQEKQQAYEQAAQWYMQMQEQPLRVQQQTEFEQWLNANSLHQQIWRNVAMFDEKFHRVPKHRLAKTVQQLNTRPHTLGKLGMAFITGLAALYAYQGIRQQDYFPELLSFDPVAVYRTGIGGQQHLILDDGSRIWLNSNSKIRVKYNARQRRIELTRGEIYIETHKDDLKRQFRVQTSHGELVALGTVFNVRYFPKHTELLVQEGAVRILTQDQGVQQDVPARHAAIFNQDKIDPQHYQATQTLWRQHLLVVHSMRLKQFVNELSRYYQGDIDLEPSLHNILVSGSYSTMDIEKTLAMVADTHDLRIQINAQQKIRLEP